MAAYSKSSGSQGKQLLRDIKSAKRDLQKATDRAIALADIPSGLASRPATYTPTPRPNGGGYGYRGDPAQGSNWAEVQSVTAPKSGGSEAYQLKGNTATFGVSGTPITSGFLTDLGEYNPELMGRNAIPIYEKMRRGSAQVRGILAACKWPVMAASPDVIPGVDKDSPGHAKAKEIAQAVKDNLFGGLEFRTSTGGMVSQRWSDVVRNLLLCLDFGCAVYEDVWTVDGKLLKLRSLPDRLPLTFYRWHTEPDGETLLALEQYGYRGNQFLNAPLPAEKMCRITFQQEGANFWGISLLRAMYPHWFYIDRLQKIDVIGSERNSMGVPCFRLPIGFSKEDRDAAINLVTQLSTSEATGVVEPPGDANTGLRLVATNGRVKPVIPSIVYHNTQMSKAALTMFMESGQTPHGNRSVVGEHADFFMLSLQGLADQIGESITNTTVRRFVEFNYGLDAAIPKLVLANVESRQLLDYTDALAKLAQAGLVVSEGNIRTHIREELALPDETAEGIVAPRGMTITPMGETATGGVEAEGGKKNGKPVEPQNIVIGKGGLPPGYEQQLPARLQPAPTSGKANGNGKMSYVVLPDDERTDTMQPGMVFLTDHALMTLDKQPRSGPFLVVHGPSDEGTFYVIARNENRIDVEHIEYLGERKKKWEENHES